MNAQRNPQETCLGLVELLGPDTTRDSSLKCESNGFTGAFTGYGLDSDLFYY